MKQKLRKFQEFAEGLLPHETGWLVTIHQFTDPEKIAILVRLDHNSRLIHNHLPFDENIDKRKYSYIITWVGERLATIDVDHQFRQLVHLEEQIATDAIQPDEERQLSRILKETDHRSYNFAKIYELARQYRHFLLIRMRYRQHQEVDEFLRSFRAHFDHSRDIGDKIHYATQDIVKQYAGSPAESIQWERWLTDVFTDDQIDGANRYMALVRLTFLYFNYKQFRPLREKFDTYDALLTSGVYYSRRLLINYYSNRLLLHNFCGEYDQAIWYGYLSIRERNTDYIHYVNTLSGVLLRQQQNEQALAVMRKAYPELKATISFHNRLVFVAFYLRGLHANGLLANAENYAESFLRAYSQEIFDHRWHLFFTVFFDILLHRDKTARLVRLARKYRVVQREKEQAERSGTHPYLLWQYTLAAYVEMKITRTKLEDMITRLPASDDTASGPGLQAFLVHLKRLAPEVARFQREQSGER